MLPSEIFVPVFILPDYRIYVHKDSMCEWMAIVNTGLYYRKVPLSELDAFLKIYDLPHCTKKPNDKIKYQRSTSMM